MWSYSLFGSSFLKYQRKKWTAERKFRRICKNSTNISMIDCFIISARNTIVFECHWKAWFDIRLLAHEEFVDVSYHLDVNIIGKIVCKCWLNQQYYIRKQLMKFPIWKEQYWHLEKCMLKNVEVVNLIIVELNLVHLVTPNCLDVVSETNCTTVESRFASIRF